MYDTFIVKLHTHKRIYHLASLLLSRSLSGGAVIGTSVYLQKLSCLKAFLRVTDSNTPPTLMLTLSL